MTSPMPPPSPPPRILVIGAGAVGALYGGMLAQAGASVSCVCRSDFHTVAKSGFQIQSRPWGDFLFRPEQVIRQTGDYQGGPPDYLLVALKVLPEIDLPTLIRPAIGSRTAIVLLQNGIEIEAPVAATFPKNEIISALAFVCSNRQAPGKILHLDYGRLNLGTWPQGVSPAAERLAACFNQAGVPVATTETVVAARWKKLIWNAAFNPLSVATGGLTTRELLDAPETAKLARAIMEEVVAIARADGWNLTDKDVEKNLAATQTMTPYKTSMTLDYEAGRPMEVEAILGHALAVAQRQNVPVPHIQTVFAILSRLDHNRRHKMAKTRRD